MLLRRVWQLPDGSEWAYEAKWDGYRMQAIKCGRTVRLISRNGADFTGRFPEVAQSVAGLEAAILHLDGELVAMDDAGRPSFQVLQGRKPMPKPFKPGYYAFDIFRCGRQSFSQARLPERRARLEELLAGSAVRFSPTLRGTADQVVAAVRELRLEGIVAKNVASFYEPGKRSGAWVKFPCKQTDTFLIGGFRPAGQTSCLLLVGRFDGARFRFAGKVRHHFDARAGAKLFGAMERLRTHVCPFHGLPNVKSDPFDENITPEEMPTFTWINPEVEVGVAYSEWTRMNTLRHPELVVG